MVGLHDFGDVARPVRELKGFRKLRVAANGSAEIVFTLTRETLALADGTVEPGAFQVWIAPHAEAGDSASFVLAPRA